MATDEDIRCTDHPIVSFSGFHGVVAKKFVGSAWIFRGQKCANWLLEPTIERDLQREYERSFTVKLPRRLNREKTLLTEFRRRAHHYIRNAPGESEIAEWFALMRHHGVPTRLLDWTLSPYVALYFALEEKQTSRPNTPPGDHCVWAIDKDWIECFGTDGFTGDEPPSDETKWHEWMNHVILEPKNPDSIVVIRSLRSNEREAAQQGLFLCNLNQKSRFHEVIRNMASSSVGEKSVHRILIKPSLRIQFLKELARMNISRATLYPGLDGFGRSLGMQMEIYDDEEFDGIFSKQRSKDKGSD